MRIRAPRDIAAAVRGRRLDLGLTQAAVAVQAGVSRKWVYEFEAGKPTAEIGLIFKVLHALELILEASPSESGSDDFDLDDVLRAQGQLGHEETGRG